MLRKPITLTVFALALSLLASLLILPPAMAQGPDPQQPFAVYFARLRLPEPGVHGDAMASFQAAYDRLRPTLLELKADGQLLAFEPLPEIGSVRLVAVEEAITVVVSRPEVAEVKPLHARPEAEPVDEVSPSEPPSSVAPPAPSSEPPSPVAPVAPPLMATQTYTISGTVQDYDDTPMEDVWVRTSGGPVYDSDYTDASGVYTLTVSAGTYTIRASKSGLPGPPEQTVTVPPDQVVDFTFPERFTISGTVRDYDDTPIEGAWVSTDYGDPVYVSDNTDASGAYTLAVIAGTYTVSASKSGLPGPPEQTVTVPPDQVVDFTFPERFTISGTVRDYDGTPIEDAQVGASIGGSTHYVYTDASGVYTSTVSAGTYTIRASKSGLPSPPEQTVTVPPDQIVDFTFPERFTISGTVRDYDGTPMENALVRTSGGPVSDSDYTERK